MGIAFLHGNGGSSGAGGSELTIVGGTTRPAKATQNTIWINTDTEITSYALSATEPEKPVEGMAWIVIENSSFAKVTLSVGGDWITVCPMSTKQYIGGAWVVKIATSYQNGVWVDWLVYIHSVTNGYNADRFGSYSTPVMGSGGNAFAADESGIYTDDGYPILSNFIIDKPIDLTPYSYIEFEVKGTTGSDSWAGVGFTSTNSTNESSLKPNNWGEFAWSGGYSDWTLVRIDLTGANTPMYFRVGQHNCRNGYYVRNIVLA